MYRQLVVVIVRRWKAHYRLRKRVEKMGRGEKGET